MGFQGPEQARGPLFHRRIRSAASYGVDRQRALLLEFRDGERGFWREVFPIEEFFCFTGIPVGVGTALPDHLQHRVLPPKKMNPGGPGSWPTSRFFIGSGMVKPGNTSDQASLVL